MRINGVDGDRRRSRPSAFGHAGEGEAFVEFVAGGENARRWLADLRHVKLHIDGHDLLAAGIAEGPEIGARLRRALDLVLDGEIANERDAELAAALEDPGDG